MSESVIKKIEKKKGEYLIVFPDFQLSLCESFFSEELLYVGKELSDEDRIRLKKLSEINGPYEYARSLLLRSSYSSHAIKEKIKAKYPQCAYANETILKLKKEGLLDDSRYAETYKDYKEAELYGPKRILDDLRYKKGISDEILDNLEFQNERDALNKLFPIINNKYKGLPYKKKASKVENALLVRGFSKDLAKEYASKAEIDPKEVKKNLMMDFSKSKRNHSKKYKGYELKQRIIRSLLSKGYTMNEIKEVLEDE